MDTTEWHKRIAKRAETTPSEVIRVLDAQAVPGRRGIPSRQQLRVVAVHFAGVKNRLGGDDRRELVPFSFTHVFSAPLTAFATHGKNDAGKSTVLEMVLWAVRGVSDVAPDVRAWTRHVIVALRVGDDDVLVAWTLDGKYPAGLILTLPPGYEVGWAALDGEALRQMREDAAGEQTTEAWDDALLAAEAAGAVVTARFRDEDGFKLAVAEFMGERLGFERLDTFKKNNNASDDTDGTPVSHDWPLWSQALMIPKKTITSTLGEDTMTASFVIETYLGTTWGPSKVAARARWKSIDSDTASQRRAFQRDDDTQRAAAAALEEELADAIAQRDALPSTAALDAMETASAALASEVPKLADAEVRYADAAAEQARLRAELVVATADLAATRDAAVTDKFWNALKPSCCPRCDAQVDATRWAREDEGQCSLCDSPLDLDVSSGDSLASADDEELDDDSADDEHAAGGRIEVLETALAEASGRVDAASQTRDATRSRVTELRDLLAEQRFDPFAAHRLDLQIATLTGRIDERAKTVVRADDLARVDQVLRVLKATETESERLRSLERSHLLEAVSSHLVELGKRLGFRELEQATFKGNGHLPVVKGGEPANFGQLTDGEKLRMKIAIVIALLRVGNDARVGRHPGLLIIDSPASEEMDANDVRQMLSELTQIGEEVGLQVITSSANAELMLSVLGPDAVRVPPTGAELLW